MVGVVVAAVSCGWRCHCGDGNCSRLMWLSLLVGFVGVLVLRCGCSRGGCVVVVVLVSAVVVVVNCR